MHYVWPTTISIGVISLSTFFTLVFIRYFRDRNKEKAINRKKELERLLLTHLSNPLKDLKSALLKTHKDMALVAQISPAMLRTLKGNSYQRLLDSLHDVGLYDWAFERLHKKNRLQKIEAIKLVAYWPDKPIKREFKTLLENKHPLVRQAALIALADTKDTSMLPIIIQAFIQKSDFSAPLMSNLFQKFGAEISKQLTTLITSPNIPVRVKIPALMALVKTEDTEQIVLAATLLCWHNDDELRAMAYLAMSETGEPMASNLIQSGAKDGDWRLRQSVASCAANCNPLPAAILTELLRDKNWLVGLRSGQVLFASGILGRKLLETIANGTHLGSERAKMILSEHAHKENGEEDGMA